MRKQNKTKKVWFEVYQYSNKEGTQTLVICATKKEAIETARKLILSGKRNIQIDKWTDQDNPYIIADIIFTVF